MRAGQRQLMIFAAVFAVPSTVQSEDFTPIFDGQSLSGWEGNHEQFRVEDDAIVGGTFDAEIVDNEFLCTKQRYSDFELHLEARMSDAQIGGVSFRAERVPESTEVGGYQADMGYIPGRFMPVVSSLTDVDPDDSYPLWGSLLDEFRPIDGRYPDPTNPYLLIAIADRSLVDNIVKPNDWNRIVITAIGPEIEIHLNGEKTIQYTEPEDVPSAGLICVQVHFGEPSEARYRNIRIREIDD